jgi:cell division protein FtsW
VNFSPPTGVTLPFFSFGGTSLLITMMEMAIVMSISRQITAKANKQIKNRR